MDNHALDRLQGPKFEKASKPLRLAYSVDEAAEVVGLGKTTLYALIGNGRLPSCKIGNRRLIRAADLENLLSPDRGVPGHHGPDRAQSCADADVGYRQQKA